MFKITIKGKNLLKKVNRPVPFKVTSKGKEKVQKVKANNTK